MQRPRDYLSKIRSQRGFVRSALDLTKYGLVNDWRMRGDVDGASLKMAHCFMSHYDELTYRNPSLEHRFGGLHARSTCC